MIRNILSARIRDFHLFEKEVERVAMPNHRQTLIDSTEEIFIDHVLEALGGGMPSSMADVHIPTKTIILNADQANDGKRHHFYFAFIWEHDRQQVGIYYLTTESFKEEDEEKQVIYYTGFETLKYDYATIFISSHYEREVANLIEVATDILENLEIDHPFNLTLYAESEESIDKKPRLLRFRLIKKKPKESEIWYLGCEETEI